MTHRLTLMRHGQAQTEGPNGDAARTLEEWGVREVLASALRLVALKFSPPLILTSSAIRASQTAHNLCMQWVDCKVKTESRLYLATPKILLEVIAEQHFIKQHLLIVGHNPGLSELAKQLSEPSSATSQNFKVLNTAEWYTAEFEILSWYELFARTKAQQI